MKVPINFAGGAEVWVAAALLLFLVLVIVRMMRSKGPDPKMELLLTLMKDFPKDDGGGNPTSGDPEDDPRKDHGPLGPDSFSLNAAFASGGRVFQSRPDDWHQPIVEGRETIPPLVAPETNSPGASLPRGGLA